ncbi:DNA polymerase III subunit delta [uncultured Nocardioides sp.]|uniref:DNA polymerase III subunit delta n=1 Tax=uncultured Nocardioides sp. TaxID=198441 RepID=UPI002617FB5D|nr:DNA polymerase III subunit delta [uncultured Nocardioides sp.]
MARSSAATSVSSAPASVLGRVTLVTGKEEFLRDRVVRDVRAAVREADVEAELSETRGSELTLATLGELAAPSLFSSTRGVVVWELENLPEESVAGLVGYAAEPAEDVALVLVHSGGPRGSGVLTKLRKLPGVADIQVEEVKGYQMSGFAQAEIRRHGSRLDPDTAGFLVQAVGHDLRSLAAAAHQLATDFPGRTVSSEEVKRYFGGRSEATSFAVADHALEGRRTEALEELRWALDGGVAPVLVTSAFASGARGLARFATAPRGMRDADLAREVGVPPWKLKSLRSQVRGWDERSLAAVLVEVARTDADVKGAATDAAYALERMTLTVCALRRG